MKHRIRVLAIANDDGSPQLLGELHDQVEVQRVLRLLDQQNGRALKAAIAGIDDGRHVRAAGKDIAA